MNSSGSGWGPISSCCENVNKTLGSVECGKFCHCETISFLETRCPIYVW